MSMPQQRRPGNDLTDKGWRPSVPLDRPVMRPDDRAEVTRKLVELNGEIM